MSLLTEKNAFKAHMTTILTAAGTFTPVSPDTFAAHVFMYVLPEPNNAWPAIVLFRHHWTVTEIAALGQKGNDDNDPNIYGYKYFDQLISQTGSTVEATMDAHDAFLEAMVTHFQSSAGYYLADGSNVRQVQSAGEVITNDSNDQGPYDLLSGSATLLSEGTIHVKQLPRPPLP